MSLASGEPARVGIGRRINVAIRAAFTLVLLVGGISVLLAWTIFAGVEEARQQSDEVQAVNQIHGTVLQFIGDLFLVLHGVELPSHRRPEEVLEDLKQQVLAYEALEHAQAGDEAQQELAELARLKALLIQLEGASRAAMQAAVTGRSPTADELLSMSAAAHAVGGVVEKLHEVHRRKFQRATERTQGRMILISVLYVAFAVGGGVLLLLGDRFLSRRLVSPIVRLAEAALQIASGNLSRRVPVRSSDELGQLSRAFNVMAERLEAHEAERLTFEAELERQVKERTRELEATTTTLRATQAQLIRSERVAVTGQIAAGVTHEIRTPLNSLAINVQLLRRELSAADVPPNAEILAVLATVEYEITRINRTLEEFVNFARLPLPRFERIEIVPLVREILGLLGPQAAATGVRIERPPTASVPAIRGDPDQLRQVVLNLVQNALQAMPDGGVLGMEVGLDGEWVEMAVTDSGPGIPEGERGLIFLPFFSTRANGLGLGLPMVRRIVEEHAGTISCHNRAEGGARFVVRLPAAGAGLDG